jgi:allophanate hydrolase subunit 1
MRNIKKSEINTYITEAQRDLISKLKETGINMSSLSRLAIRKYGADSIETIEDTGKKIRVNLYLEPEDLKNLQKIAQREGIKSSEVLRHLISKYLRLNENALMQLI